MIGMRLTLPDGQSLETLQYVLSYANGKTVQAGAIDTSHTQSISFQIGNVPAGGGYTVAIRGSTAGGTTCAGSAGPFSVSAHSTTGVSVNVACSASGTDAGNVMINGNPYYCATWNSLATGSTGSEANVGSSVQLIATATGPDPSGLTYSWSSSNKIGTFGSEVGEGGTDSIAFTCTAPGATTITVVVGDGAVPGGGTCPIAQDTVSTTVTCDAADGGVVTLGSTSDGGLPCVPSACNACGGIPGPGPSPSPCGTCGDGRWECDGPDLVCVGASAVNACGGCGPVAGGTPGDPCGDCPLGQLVCDGGNAVTCSGGGSGPVCTGQVACATADVGCTAVEACSADRCSLSPCVDSACTDFDPRTSPLAPELPDVTKLYQSGPNCFGSLQTFPDLSVCSFGYHLTSARCSTVAEVAGEPPLFTVGQPPAPFDPADALGTTCFFTGDDAHHVTLNVWSPGDCEKYALAQLNVTCRKDGF